MAHGDPARLSAPQVAALATAVEGSPLYVSDVTLLEIAQLHGRGRIRFSLPLREWLEAATAAPLVERIGITPAIAAEVACVPDSFHRDPADRALVATAKVLGAHLVTSDGKIRESGLVPVV